MSRRPDRAKPYAAPRSAPRGALALLLALVAQAPAHASPGEIFSEDFESGTVCGWPARVGGPDCAGPFSIDLCALHFPTAASVEAGSALTAYARLFIAGLTDESGTNDPAPEVTAALGVGPDGSDPSDEEAGWAWSPAAPNPFYGPGSPSYAADHDEYEGTMTVPSPDSYDFAFRFSGDSKLTYVYCDAGDGSSDGYQAENAGQLTSLPP